jgi:membrane associated rhomboid family serine protease
MAYIPLIALTIIITNIIFTYKGLKSHSFFDDYRFDVDHILVYRDYKRFITSGFLHVNWMHLIFNMISLYVFTPGLELFMGAPAYFGIYFGSLIGGNLFALYIHRHHGDYSAVGASGAVSGIVFAAIVLQPDLAVGFMYIPIAIPGWIYGLFYVLYSIYGIRSRKDNIGHEAHLGGALIGLFLAVCLHPVSLYENYRAVLAITIPGLIFIYMIITRPYLLLVDNNFFKKHKSYIDIDHLYNMDKAAQQRQIDAVLEKIHHKGISSLTKKEKDLLDKYSKSMS